MGYEERTMKVKRVDRSVAYQLETQCGQTQEILLFSTVSVFSGVKCYDFDCPEKVISESIYPEFFIYPIRRKSHCPNIN